ncbi:MAG TPA: beta-ketoacyl-ACP synthase III [Planctomycetota bacterium]|nr:beta-ketoacyl-ACP synthase III [Planctomycetota bacterium]
MRVKILGTGSYAPPRVITNHDLEKMVDTNDKWITERTGIKQRHAADPGVPTSVIAANAAKKALEMANVKPEEIDTIVVATSSGDRIVPPTAVYVQRILGCWNAGCYDLVAACTGFAYGLSSGRAYISSGQSKRCLVIGAEELSKITDYKDRTTCILFGDGAGAVVLGPSDDDSDILYSKMGCDGRNADLIITPAGGSDMPLTPEIVEKKEHMLRMKGREVYKFAIPKFVEIIQTALIATDLKISEIDHFVPHQMNARMIEAVAERLAFPMEKIVINIADYGNTSAASIPIALDEAVRAGRIKRGDIILMSAMGAGITWGTVVLRW